MSPDSEFQPSSAPVWQCVLLAAFAGGLAWGIRGQYGHETGAMLAGLLVGLTLTLLLCPHAKRLAVARAVALCTVAIGIGGSETYAQTIGLTQNPPVLGNWEALRWGMLGLAVKGSLWIGFGGIFLGMGLGGVRYRPLEMLLVMLGLIGLSYVGYRLLNEPFDPENKVLPRIYFSADWYWEPGTDNLKPRREFWGGLWLALAGLIAYTGGVRRDALALHMGLWGILGGAVGFPFGQCIQAYHAWNIEFFRTGWLAKIDPIINWWNFMETTFGAVMGGFLGLGLWLNRYRIKVEPGSDKSIDPAAQITSNATLGVSVSWSVECLLIAVHIFLLLCAEFNIVRGVGWIYGPGLQLALIPIVMIVGGRKWPYWLMFPITIIPIAGKTLRNLHYENYVIELVPGWLLYVMLPVAVMTASAIVFSRLSAQQREARPFLRIGLLLATWIVSALNFAFFRYPWPWDEWTNRTPNAIAFLICAIGLTILAVRARGKKTATRD